VRRPTYWVLVAAPFWSLFVAFACTCTCGVLNPIRGHIPGTISAAYAEEQTETASISKLRVSALYKAVRLTWVATIDSSGPVTFEIYRSQATPDGPYRLVTSLEWRPGVKKYRYVDKDLPVEENYFYKIEIPATNESFGPLQVRPSFSLPAT
jgi:hypothetical protein